MPTVGKLGRAEVPALGVFALALGVYAVTRLVALEDFPIYFFADEALEPVLASELLPRPRDYLSVSTAPVGSDAGRQGPGRLTILMPARNEAVTLERSATAVLSRLDAHGMDAELLIVDDASDDRTASIAAGLARRDRRTRVVRHRARRGIGGALVTGIAEATGDWLVVIPADLPLDLDDLSRYWEAARHADVVVGVRSDRGDVSWFRRAVSVVNIRLIRLLFRARQRQFTFISLYRLDVLREIDIEYWRSGFFFAEIILKATALGRRVVEVEVRYLPRQGGKATGARWPFVLRTGRDLCRFWLRWWWRGPQTASRRPAA